MKAYLKIYNERKNFIMIKLVVESTDGFMIKTVTSAGSYYLIKSATRNKSFWNKSISDVNEFKSKDAALRKLYTVLERLPENAFYDDEDMYDIEDESDIRNARFAKFYITDTHGNTLEDISDKVKDYLLSSHAFMAGFDLDDEDDEDLDESVLREYTSSDYVSSCIPMYSTKAGLALRKFATELDPDKTTLFIYTTDIYGSVSEKDKKKVARAKSYHPEWFEVGKPIGEMNVLYLRNNKKASALFNKLEKKALSFANEVCESKMIKRNRRISEAFNTRKIVANSFQEMIERMENEWGFDCIHYDSDYLDEIPDSWLTVYDGDGNEYECEFFRYSDGRYEIYLRNCNLTGHNMYQDAEDDNEWIRTHRDAFNK